MTGSSIATVKAAACAIVVQEWEVSKSGVVELLPGLQHKDANGRG